MVSLMLARRPPYGWVGPDESDEPVEDAIDGRGEAADDELAVDGVGEETEDTAGRIDE